MTEIKIEKKQSTLPLVLLGLSIIALLFYVLVFNKNDAVATVPVVIAPTVALIDVHENNSTVAAYTTLINSGANKMTLDHAFSNEALLKLTDATNAMADAVGFSVKADLNKVKELADKITIDRFETTHADNIRLSADILTTALQNLQQAKYPSLTNEVLEVKNAAAAINPDILTLKQQDAVKSFFAKAAILLEKMN